MAGIMDSRQAIHEMYAADPVEFNMQNLKTQVFMSLMSLIRTQKLSQAEVARRLGVTQPRVSNLFNEHLEKFSIDALLGMMVKMGYKIDATFNPDNTEQPMVMSLRKSAF
ncbi:helix-turn-helix domain-containing protein [Pseudomonas putida]|nr:XRE family transcriptional regulator [Pseudomonas putida]